MDLIQKKLMIKPMLKVSALTIAIFMANQSAFALQAMDEDTMRRVDGRDGVIIDTQYGSLNFDRLFWEDKAGTSTNAEVALRGYADGVSVTGANLGTTYSINAGSSGTKTGLDFNLTSRYGTIKADSFKICDNTGSCTGVETMGGLTLQSQDNLNIRLTTTDGLFNRDEAAHLELGIKNLNIYLTQKSSSLVNNQLIAKDFNFNFSGDGYVWVSDNGGFSMETRDVGNNVYLNRVNDLANSGKTKPGLNIDLLYRGGIPNSETDANKFPSVIAYTGTYPAKGVIRVGASGRATNASLVFRGVNAVGLASTPLTSPANIAGMAFAANNTEGSGTNATVIGSTGIAMRMKADLIGTGADQIKLELGHAGDNAYGVEFSKLSPLLIRKDASGTNPELTNLTGVALNTANAQFDTGDIYINLANTKRLLLPVNTTLNNARFGAGTGTLTTNADYQYQVHNAATNPNMLVTAIRGFNFDAVSRAGRFIVSNDVPITSLDHPDNAAYANQDNNTWGLGLPIYNMNGNIAVFGTKVSGAERLGLSLGLSTQGGNAAGDKTTSILLIDGASNPFDSNNPTNYYFGIRNIDMLLTADGTLGAEAGDRINIDLNNVQFVAAADMAAGYLPGSRYASACTASATVSCYAATDSFSTITLKDVIDGGNTAALKAKYQRARKDVLYGLKLKLQANPYTTVTGAITKPGFTIALVPGGNATLAQNRLSFEGGIMLKNSAIQISDPVDGSILGLDNINGQANFTNQIQVNRNNIVLNTRLDINKEGTDGATAANALRIKDVNLYPADKTTGVIGRPQRLGEIALTGGTLTSRLSITPR